ncbi:MAG TPA: preprotein translocase subunit SecG [Sphingobacteriaceae bacterium]|nr:preprotein translocase subunit SecG [Sphingobacteriaceae bacterium]
MKYVLIVLQVIFSIGIIAAVLLQSGRQAGLSGAIAGGAETFFGKKRGLDQFLARVTLVLAGLFFLTSFLMLFV